MRTRLSGGVGAGRPILPATRLITAGLLAYRKPLYQMLALPKPEAEGPRTGQVHSLGELLRKIAGGAA